MLLWLINLDYFAKFTPLFHFLFFHYFPGRVWKSGSRSICISTIARCISHTQCVHDNSVHVRHEQSTRVHVHETRFSSLSFSPLPSANSCGSPFQHDDSRPASCLVSPSRSFGVVLLCVSQHNWRHTVNAHTVNGTQWYSLYRCVPKLFLPNPTTCSMAGDDDERRRRCQWRPSWKMTDRV